MNFTKKQYLGSIASISCRKEDPSQDKIPVYTVKNNTEYFTLAQALIDKSDGVCKDVNLVRRCKPSDDNIIANIITGIPNFGIKNAEKVIEYFNIKKIGELCNLTQGDLMAVDGIGKGKAQKIKKWFD